MIILLSSNNNVSCLEFDDMYNYVFLTLSFSLYLYLEWQQPLSS